MLGSSPTFQPISTLPEIRDLLDDAPGILRADISRVKKLLASSAVPPMPSDVALTIQKARDALKVLHAHGRQLAHWLKDPISDAERSEIIRLQAIIPEIRPLIQRHISLATELHRRAIGRAPSRKSWRHL